MITSSARDVALANEATKTPACFPYDPPEA